jgi:hypothetical protein
MKRAVALAALALAACEPVHTLTLQYGPEPGTVSRGFTCAPLVPAPPFELRLVVELIDLGPAMPSCLSESLVDHCSKAGACTVVARRCSELGTVTAQDLMDTKTLVRERLALIPDDPITNDAPDRPSLVRAMVTSQACDDPAMQDFGTPITLGDVFGCAATCPFLPDAIDGPLVLGLETEPMTCANDIRGCASLGN